MSEHVLYYIYKHKHSPKNKLRGVALPTTLIYNGVMEKNIQRPLCQANNNTCPNLGESKGKKRSGETRYGRLCDKHRRKGHDLRAFRNPDSIRYLPLNKCSMCSEKAVDRHRIIPGTEYIGGKVVGVCKPCHRKIHLFYDCLKEKGYTIHPQGII